MAAENDCVAGSQIAVRLDKAEVVVAVFNDVVEDAIIVAEDEADIAGGSSGGRMREDAVLDNIGVGVVGLEPEAVFGLDAINHEMAAIREIHGGVPRRCGDVNLFSVVSLENDGGVRKTGLVRGQLLAIGASSN